MDQGEHHDSSTGWLIFFFVCFGIVMLGVVAFFAHDVNSEKETKPAGAHGGMILPIDGDYAPHAHAKRIA